MFLSFGGLDSDGGYNIRVCRSENPNGPYVDSMGQDMKDCKGPAGSAFSDATAEQYGTKLMGGYKFTQRRRRRRRSKGYLSLYYNSCLYQEETGKYFIIYHTRFENSGETHEVRVHQMFLMKKAGWLLRHTAIPKKVQKNWKVNSLLERINILTTDVISLRI